MGNLGNRASSLVGRVVDVFARRKAKSAERAYAKGERERLRMRDHKSPYNPGSPGGPGGG